MESVKNLCVRLIEAKKFDGLQEKLDAFYEAGKLTKVEYDELCGMMPKSSDEE